MFSVIEVPPFRPSLKGFKYVIKPSRVISLMTRLKLTLSNDLRLTANFTLLCLKKCRYISVVGNQACSHAKVIYQVEIFHRTANQSH